MNDEKILIVDDEKDILELLRYNLAKEGYQVLCAASGEEAISIASSELPELILLDIMMPVMDGYEVCRSLKTDPKNQITPVIFLTAMQEVKNKISGFDAGAVDYITKPFSIPEVIARVKNHLTIKKSYQEVNKAKSEFLAKVSHEIRNPVNGIMGITELLLETGLTSKQQHYLSVLSSASDSLLSLINDILDFSKIEAGKVEIDILDFDIRKTVGEIEDLLAVNANKKGLEFGSLIDSNVPSFLRGDPKRLRQILLNLAGNAIKFTSKGEVFIRVSNVKETLTQATVRFMITDTGIGIPSNHLDRLFKPFSQVDRSTTRNHGGTGLGLMISKQLVEMMGGEIGVNSEEGKKTTFWFTAVFEKQNKKEPVWQFPDDIKTKRILIVDDNVTHLEIISNYLKSWDCKYNTACNTDEAMTLLKQGVKDNDRFNLVILDKIMPEVDGIELGRMIKKDSMLKETVLIRLIPFGLSNNYDDDKSMKDIGCFAYLTKPVKRLKLFDCIINGLKQKTCKQKLSILLVEDNLFYQELVLRLLFMHSVKKVNNRREALEALQKEKFDLILIDLQIPEIGGLEFITNIRDSKNEFQDHNIPIIAMDSYGLNGHGLEEIVNGYITKPIDPKKLLEIINRTIIKIQD